MEVFYISESVASPVKRPIRKRNKIYLKQTNLATDCSDPCVEQPKPWQVSPSKLFWPSPGENHRISSVLNLPVSFFWTRSLIAGAPKVAFVILVFI